MTKSELEKLTKADLLKLSNNVSLKMKKDEMISTILGEQKKPKKGSSSGFKVPEP